ncbi:Glycosyl hydrolase family 67 N-terminus [Psychrobacillus sp. OK028]|uniref:alpha-glucuronidase family glycosyl hydrolase n=1 Tax=Psychrobacillus sp. OK028 TaxID=1884359 RepID=UPI00088BAAAD|nr:alpha-glucuronidase family glycosyl hydrolase [Psychrobacillus sp. OK028]SDN56919.1 Glycosyl hydrolase family 67 N-terminus [Psychrobacillus sp. OK028]
MLKIIYCQSHETILFAIEELKRLVEKAGYESSIHDKTYLPEANEADKRIILITTIQYREMISAENVPNINADGFAFVSAGNDLWIIGNEPRALLYGVYEYCKKFLGYQWIHLDKEEMVELQDSDDKEVFTHEPMFVRRGNILETINDPGYINSLIDWGVKNGQNEFFFTFFLWDEIKSYVRPGLKKRDVQVTLGGHSLKYLLGKIQKDQENNQINNYENLEFFAENVALQDEVINKIISICSEDEVITRISLWPEDVGIEEKNADGFLSNYIRFTERLNSSLKAANLEVEVEYIVYNAGLSWDMLERRQTEVSAEVDVLYAYWGRDYSNSLHSSEPNQVKAKRTLDDWNTQAISQGRSLTVLEYYSDHFMLSELFPPLLTRIASDLQDYKQLQVQGALNLIVPMHRKPTNQVVSANYPWKWIHHLNNYIYSRVAWGEELEIVLEEYFSVFQEEKDTFRKMLLDLEKLISPFTRWNVPLFPERVVDPEKVMQSANSKQISTELKGVDKYLSTIELSGIESLLVLQRKDNYNSFSQKEMTLFYIYYLRLINKVYANEWENMMSKKK